MTSPRPINPEGIPDDAWWDCEALKLAVLDPARFRDYANRSADRVVDTILAGVNGLHALGFLKMKDPKGDIGASDRHHVEIYGQYLIDACRRVSK